MTIFCFRAKEKIFAGGERGEELGKGGMKMSGGRGTARMEKRTGGGVISK